MATIVYTSGTTGRPKGCVLTHRNIHSDVSSAIAVLPQLLHPGASTVLFLPLAHAYARLIQVGMVRTRATMVHSADIAGVLDQLRRHQPTFVLAVPRVFEKMYNRARQKADGAHRGWLFTAAEQVAVRHSRASDTPRGPGGLLRPAHALFIVTAAGKNLSPAPIEETVRAHPLVSQCMIVGDGRPYVAALVTIDPQAWQRWRTSYGRPDASIAELRDDPRVRAEIQAAVDRANRAVSRAEQIKAFRILPRDFTETDGELTPTLKIKREVVAERYADDIDASGRCSSSALSCSCCSPCPVRTRSA